MQIRFKNIALSSHFAVVSSFVHKRSMNTYPKCDTPPSRSARYSLAPLQKSRRKSPFLCEKTEAESVWFRAGAKAIQYWQQWHVTTVSS